MTPITTEIYTKLSWSQGHWYKKYVIRHMYFRTSQGTEDTAASISSGKEEWSRDKRKMFCIGVSRYKNLI